MTIKLAIKVTTTAAHDVKAYTSTTLGGKGTSHRARGAKNEV